MENKNQKLAKHIGRKGFILYDNVLFPVEVKDVRTFYGRPQVLIIPIGGKGEVWKYLAKIKFQ